MDRPLSLLEKQVVRKKDRIITKLSNEFSVSFVIKLILYSVPVPVRFLFFILQLFTNLYALFNV